MVGLMAAGRVAADRPSLEAADLPPLLLAANEAIGKRGGAKPGDKTVLDAMAAVAAAIESVDSFAGLKQASPAAARAALETFRDRPNRIGRAGRYGEVSRGADDPGMLAFAILCDALTEEA